MSVFMPVFISTAVVASAAHRMNGDAVFIACNGPLGPGRCIENGCCLRICFYRCEIEVFVLYEGLEGKVVSGGCGGARGNAGGRRNTRPGLAGGLKLLNGVREGKGVAAPIEIVGAGVFAEYFRQGRARIGFVQRCVERLFPGRRAGCDIHPEHRLGECDFGLDRRVPCGFRRRYPTLGQRMH